MITSTSALSRPPTMEESSVRTASSTPFNSSIFITCSLMRSTVDATALLCSGETFRMPMRPSTTCSTSSWTPLRPPTTLNTSPSAEKEEGGRRGSEEWA